MRRLLRARSLVLLLLGGPLLLAAVAMPGWRHRHAGGIGHSHGHDHGHDHPHGRDHAHPHSHGHDHSHGRDGWHVHVTLFGLELTLWEPGSDEPPHDHGREAPRPRHRESRDGGEGPVIVAATQTSLGWVSLLYFDPAPVPSRVALAGAFDASALLLPADAEVGSRADAPPVPPPETV